MKRHFFAIFIILFCVKAQALFLKNCLSKINYSHNQQIQLKGRFQRVYLDSVVSHHVAPTNHIGTWFKFKVEKGKAVKLTYDYKSKHYEYDLGVNCKSKLASKVDRNLEDFVGGLTDRKIEKMIKGKRGILYIHSPRFALSEDFYQRIKSVLGKSKIELIKINEADIFSKKRKSLPKRFLAYFDAEPKEEPKYILSNELKNRNLGVHYPMVLFFKDNKLSRRERIGVYSMDSFRHIASRELGILL